MNYGKFISHPIHCNKHADAATSQCLRKLVQNVLCLIKNRVQIVLVFCAEDLFTLEEINIQHTTSHQKLLEISKHSLAYHLNWH